ncbi:MAG: BNR repeat-containing protein [Kiritimatiellia bacterium]|nr:BNR repeat-containing protein [Kiritimatiellia bacterium]MDP6848015.1 BNR repeat-containing protein [Kiritimatiellia bacterium]
MNHLAIPLVVILASCLPAVAVEKPMSSTGQWHIEDSMEIDKVPSWFPVGFSLLTRGKDQYVAYYNEKHQMIVARCRLEEKTYQKVVLPSKVGWDSHNYLTMAFDSTGNIHLSGNMHCVPLIYFRTGEPGDITTFKRFSMTGKGENRCTYPNFLKDAEGTLLFNYRLGGSGNGMRLWNCYNTEKKTWSRFFDTPMFDGKGKCNAYPHGPIKGPDGSFHVLWVWRETPDCATNHDLSHVRSRDLKHWESAGGKAVTLPLTTSQTELCVDPVPVKGGIINGCERLAFDSKNRPVVTYHKLDEKGHMQIFVSRFQEGSWKRHAITSWEKNIHFSGYGAMPFIGIRISGLKRIDPETHIITYRHRDYGSGRIIIDDETLMPVDRNVVVPDAHPEKMMRTTIDFESIRVKTAGDIGEQVDDNVKYMLRWETLSANYDRPRKPPLPPASSLKLLRLVKSQ